jgi:hypothetical protein
MDFISKLLEGQIQFFIGGQTIPIVVFSVYFAGHDASAAVVLNQ